jgi:hypothetical protein
MTKGKQPSLDHGANRKVDIGFSPSLIHAVVNSRGHLSVAIKLENPKSPTAPLAPAHAIRSRKLESTTSSSHE